MHTLGRYRCAVLSLVLGGIFALSFTNLDSEVRDRFPYRKAGLSHRQAAAHLLDRFTYGAKPGQIDEVVKMGLEKWFEQQLSASQVDTGLDHRLSQYRSLFMTNEEIVTTFPRAAQLTRMAIRDGVVRREDINREQNQRTRKAISEYMRKNGYGRQRDLYRELFGQRILRAAYSPNQLQEVLTGFWFNHFNVSLTDNDCARFIPGYERDVIRPNALGNFATILLATAKSPAMLTYLDNFKSTAATPEAMRSDDTQESARLPDGDSTFLKNPFNAQGKTRGLNENYAREIMELHTMGVDGGYTQRDVTEAARIFTGWTIHPTLGGYTKKNSRPGRLARTSSSKGFVRHGDFLFVPNRHDQGEKVVLGTTFPANGGYDEGVRLINMLAFHPATARFISTKLAVRFVHDIPSESLIEKMANAFTDSQGDIKQVLRAMVTAPEFWKPQVIREKIKSPFELAISSVRGLDAEISEPSALYAWISRMGERMYAYQAPTGFPDNAQYWINTGSLLARMNFGLAFASHRIPGINVDLLRLRQNREPESAEDALVIYTRCLMPERKLDETIKRLTPALTDPEFSSKIDSADARGADTGDDPVPASSDSVSMDMLAQVVGIVIGSPEFQRK